MIKINHWIELSGGLFAGKTRKNSKEVYIFDTPYENKECCDMPLNQYKKGSTVYIDEWFIVIDIIDLKEIIEWNSK